MVGGVACTRPRCVAHHGGGCHWFAIIGRQEKQKNGDTFRGGHEAFVGLLYSAAEFKVDLTQLYAYVISGR
ncbi:unnamed protein product [Macrosiphum euphorbiae]|uniref:Uncharacterized protein n=1 Tax=Macrosiphum euphorbiae TaxID=13131 RepID=A0AAV0XQQ4_9HEMI|nr:unnamed protein product [Macrosiphum euphorbiae]